MRELLKKIIPKKIFRFFQPAYHYALALTGAIRYNFPSRRMFVIGITGTKGKSSTVEIMNAILEEAGFKTALSNTIRFKIGDHSEPNMYKMSMPGRFFMQNFLWRAEKAGCTHAVLEITSEGAKQFRHKYIDLDAFIFTNLSPEHIESHGSYENYRAAKLSIAKLLTNPSKKKTYLVANGDDKEAKLFLENPATEHISYSIKNAEPYHTGAHGSDFVFRGVKMHTRLEGIFNLYNILGAATLANAMGISTQTIGRAIEKIQEIKGRVEHVHTSASKDKQEFDVVVDYAHTIDSLEQLYRAFSNRRKIAVLGNTGGGRDTWKRPGMAQIAEKYCDHIILTNEDPYDEDPQKIVDEMRAAISHKPCEIILDRREAIARALSLAHPGDVVLISGKGTDPYIMGPNGTKTPWSDSRVVKEELEKLVRGK